jgi:hypothetical protein
MFWPPQYWHHYMPFHPANGPPLPVVHRRHHSLGSGHSRDSVMDEMNTTMDQQYKCSTCRHCGHVVSRCHCKVHHHNMEPILDISRSRHGRGLSSPDLETRLSPSSKLKRVSLFDTFGIRYLTSPSTESREISLSGRRLDEELHSERLPSPGSIPLYHRPPIGHKYYQNKQNCWGATPHQHRGRRIRGDHRESSKLIAPAQKRGVDDEGSLQYPPRTFSFSSASGRTLEGSCVDDASLASFAS